jgi:ATP-dependent protease Clp ATPase subunit
MTISNQGTNLCSRFLHKVKLYFTDNALRMIAKKAAAKETGARGLRSIMEDILTEAMFEVDFYFDFGMPVGNPVSASG